jgi:RNA polymerase sigma-70 factor (ECF subfamily)
VGDGNEAALVERLRAGDEAAFVEIVNAHHAALVRIAMSFVSNRAVAEETVQDTWLAVVKGIDRFEGRSSLRTWLIGIVVNRAKTAGVKERRTVPFDSSEPTAPELIGSFAPDGSWARPPEPWSDQVDDRIVATQIVGQLGSFLDELPPMQRAVVTMRDVEGLSSAAVCEALDLSEANQRVQLHRGRTVLRARLADVMGEGSR